MSTPPPAVPETAPHAPAVLPVVPATRPFYWSIRRELWESRSVHVAPLAVAALVLFALSIGTARLPEKMRTLSALQPDQQRVALVRPFSMAPAPIMFATFLVGMFYALDALYGERRDRSILFWKSLPVSDRTTVLAKASIPLLVLPVIGFLLSVATVAALLLVSTLVLVANGMSPARLWAELGFVQEPIIMLYGLTVHALWFAPIYGWLLLISAWARRTPFLWAVLPPLALGLVEKIAFGTGFVCSLLQYRVTGAMAEAFILPPGKGVDITRLAQLDPLGFLGAAGLWIGLAAAAFFLAAAVRLRRRGEPI